MQHGDMEGTLALAQEDNLDQLCVRLTGMPKA